MNNDVIDNNDKPKSKSQIKREMTELQSLGERLLQLNNEQLKRLELMPLLMQAIIEWKKITSRSAKRRQLQYIGRLMRDIEDTQYIRDYLSELEAKNKRSTAFHHMLESWRERLLTEETAATEFIHLYPDLDRQHFRHLIKNAKRERDTGKPAGAGKQLFKYLKEIYLQVKEGKE